MANNSEVGARLGSGPDRALSGSNFYFSSNNLYLPNGDRAVQRILTSYRSDMVVRTMTIPDSLLGLPVESTVITDPTITNYGIASNRHWSYARGTAWRLGYCELDDPDNITLDKVLLCNENWQGSDSSTRIQWLTQFGRENAYWSTYSITLTPSNIPAWSLDRYDGAVARYSENQGLGLTTFTVTEKFDSAERAIDVMARLKAWDPLCLYHAALGEKGGRGGRFSVPFTGYGDIEQGKITCILPDLFLLDCGDGPEPVAPPTRYSALGCLGTLTVAEKRTHHAHACFKGLATRKGVKVDFRGTQHESRWFFPYNPTHTLHIEATEIICDLDLPAGYVHRSFHPLDAVLAPGTLSVQEGGLRADPELFRHTPFAPRFHRGIR